MRTLMTILMLVLGCGVAAAQMTMAPTTLGTGSALGATSPLGMPGMTSTTPPSPGTVPLGVTQLNVGGLSPAPGPLAGSGCSTVSGLSSSGISTTGMGTFDGGGLGTGVSGAGGMSGISGAGATGCGAASATTGTVSGLVPPGSSGTSSGIPLGATEIDSGGVSPMIVTPAPSSTTTTSGMTPGP